MTKFAITGATGYIGSCLIKESLSMGIEVLALTRNKISFKNVEWKFFDLFDLQKIELPDDISVVFHFAYDSNYNRNSVNYELNSAIRLIDASRKIGADFVYISSQSADINSSSIYGRNKWAIELITLNANGWVFKPGLVYGGIKKGLYGSLCRFAKWSPLIPDFKPFQYVQPIHIKDCVFILINYLKFKQGIILFIGSKNPVSFRDFMIYLANLNNCKNTFSIFIPKTPLLYILRIVNKLNFNINILNRLESLFITPMMIPNSSIEEYLTNGRSLNNSIFKISKQRRFILLECRLLIIYIFRDTPKYLSMRNYLRFIEKLRNKRALNLPYFFYFFPFCICFLENEKFVKNKFEVELNLRLNAIIN